jgi:hypothetical protein
VDDQAKFVEQAGVDEAGDQSRAAHDIDGLARLLPQATDLVDVVNDPRRRPARVGESLREHQMRRLRGEAGVGDLAGVGVSSEHVGGGAGVVEDGRPELLVVGEHPATEHEGVNRRQQREAVGPGVDPLGVTFGAVAVERHLA